MWAAVHVLPKSPKISDLTKKDVSWLNFSWLIENQGETAVVLISTVFVTREHVDSPQ